MMAASQREPNSDKSYIVQCSAETFEHATYLSAVHSDVLSFNEQKHSLRLRRVSPLLRTQFEKLGAEVMPYAGCASAVPVSCQI